MAWFDYARPFTRSLATLWQNERTRTQLLGGATFLASAGAVLASYAYWREPMHVQLDHLTVYLPNARHHLPATGLRLLHLSDTHFRGAAWREVPKIEAIRKACAGLQYDLLIHTGDFVHYDAGLPNVLTLLDALPPPRLGGFAVFGNHDYTTYSHSGMLGRAWTNFKALHAEACREGITVLELTQRNGNGYCHGIGNRDGNGHDKHNNAVAAHADATRHAYASNGSAHSGSTYRVTASHTVAVSDGNQPLHPADHATPPLNARLLYEFSQFCANSPLDLKRTGRNDVNALEAALAARNIQTLHNRYVRLAHADAGVDLYLAGVDDVLEGTPELQRSLAEIPYDAPTILLSHNPDILGEPGIEQADLILSGHTHGGQIVLPLIGPAHTQSLYLRRNEASGYFRRGKTQVYITRGVGEGIPLRLGATPQVTLITVLPA